MNTEFLDAVISREIEELLRVYKADEDYSRSLFLELLDMRPRVRAVIDECSEYRELSRRSLYKKFIKEFRKRGDYSLRTYRPQAETFASLIDIMGRFIEKGDRDSLEDVRMQLLALHTSTSERMPHYGEVQNFLRSALSSSSRVLDLGSGVFPLLVPFEDLSLESYTAVDRDVDALRAVEAYARLFDPGFLVARLQSLELFLNSDGDTLSDHFDTVMLWKTLPVLYRQDREVFDRLADVVSGTLIITGSKVALAKKKDIERREDQVLKEFIELCDGSVSFRFDIGSEFGYVFRVDS